MRPAALLAGLAGAVALLLAPTAPAHQSPPGCSAGGSIVNVDPGPFFIIHRNGDALTITIRLQNTVANGCDLTDVTITAELPKPDGTLGPPTVLVANEDLPAGTAPYVAATVPYTIDLDPGIFKAPIKISDSETFHGSSDTPSSGSTTMFIYISRPHATLTVTPAPSSGPAPLSTTYSYSVTNDSAANPPDPVPALGASDGDHGVISDDTCDTLTFTGGDTTVTVPPLLQLGETWTFTCTHLFGVPGTFANHASVTGGSTRDGRPWPETIAQSTVTATGPDLALTKTHAGSFTSGDAGRTYELTVRNRGNAPTSGPVQLADQLPAGLTATAIGGTGWSCALASLSCSRSDPLAASAAYPPVSVTVDVAVDAPLELTNRATVSGGGEPPAAGADNGAADPTAITPSNAFTIEGVKASRNGGASLTVTVPRAGALSADDGASARSRSAPRKPRDYVKSAAAEAAAAGSVELRLRPTKAAKRKLKKGKRLRTAVTVSFTPTGGAAAEQVVELKLRSRHRPHR